jgi:hypothetical protein
MSCRILGCGSGGYEEYCLLEYNAVKSVESQPTYRFHLPGLRISRARSKHKNTRLLSAFTLIYCSAYSSTLKMEAVCSSETSIDFQRTTRRYIPDNSTPKISEATRRICL